MINIESRYTVSIKKLGFFHYSIVKLQIHFSHGNQPSEDSLTYD